jgi:hypothetical protein
MADPNSESSKKDGDTAAAAGHLSGRQLQHLLPFRELDFLISIQRIATRVFRATKFHGTGGSRDGDRQISRKKILRLMISAGGGTIGKEPEHRCDY